jgi:glycosyltransferase involved in cell wall biosynthesis
MGIDGMKKILSLEFEAGSWSWGVISKHLHKVLKNDYTMFPVDFTSWRNTAKTAGFDLILSQNITQIKFIVPKDKTICRLGGNRSFDDVEEFTLKRYYSYLATCAAVIATNKKLYDIAIQYNPRTFLIPNGIDLQVWNSDSYKTVSPKRPFIGFIGNVSTPIKSQYKGYEWVKQACKELNLNLIEALYKTKQIPHVFMRDKFWKKIDLFVLPTAGEGCSNSILESLSMGVPTITTRCAGFHGEMLHDGVNTVFCERNAKSVKDAIQRFIVDNSLYKKISVNGRKFAEEHHDINKVALKFKEVIELCAPKK